MEQKKSNPLIWVLAILVGLLVIAVFVLGFMLASRPSTPEPEPPPEGSVPTQLPPDQPILTPGPAPTPMPGNPETELGNPDGRDDFSTSNNWTGFNNDCFMSEISDEQFVMTAKGEAGFACWETTWPSVDNFYLQTQALTPAECDADDRFGMFIRTPDLAAGYLVGLTCDGRLAMTKWDGQNTAVLVNFVSSEHINLGPGTSNRLGVLAHGDTYHLYVNGHLVAEASDASYVGAYRFGYFVRAATEEPFTVKYDDMAVWLLDE